MKRELSPRELASRLECAVDWPRKFVGVRFLFTQKEFEEARGVELTRPINYCMMVKSATLGHAVKGDASAHRCVAAARALGIAEMDEMHRSGRRGLRTQLYHDLGTAKYTRDRQTVCDHKAWGVLVKPLEQYGDDEPVPHMVLLITTPYYAMRVVQGYTYYYGIDDQLQALRPPGHLLRVHGLPLHVQPHQPLHPLRRHPAVLPVGGRGDGGVHPLRKVPPDRGGHVADHEPPGQQRQKGGGPGEAPGPGHGGGVPFAGRLLLLLPAFGRGGISPPSKGPLFRLGQGASLAPPCNSRPHLID